MTPPILITLVHGTYANGARWVKSGSLFHSGLSSHFGDRAVIRDFQWSGNNTVYARRDATYDFTKYSEKTKEEYYERHYVIAHSHGGNVVVEASVDAEYHQKQIFAGICCLATPFFHAKPRDLTYMKLDPVSWGFGGLCILLAVIAGELFSLSLEYRYALTAAAPGFGYGLAVFFGIRIAGMRPFADWYARQVHTSAWQGLNLHIIRVSGDEASLTLATGQMLSWAASRLYSGMVKQSGELIFANPLRRKFFLNGFMLNAACLGGVIAYALYKKQEVDLFYVIRYQAAIVGFFFLGSITRLYERIVLGLAVILVIVASGFASYLIGTTSNDSTSSPLRVLSLSNFVTAFCVEVDTEAAPAGHWQVCQFSKNDEVIRLAPGELIHSIYNDPRICTEVIQWIERSEACCASNG
ncbi:hypothetical protein OPKNFCMD_5243 [Methylobacterium crusticola]|uniref:Uncharacterized protein n=1 Tax=Methylobacterium crusticola TaxID=1697972 RepID=A0ABQ4R6U7_9HYPH|nr:hypothetical protein [Methylobacterium crusticola]GJD52477.1 hypothetical protein OPKNFCMD_5243 [Methylobacterium crusticola]